LILKWPQEAPEAPSSDVLEDIVKTLKSVNYHQYDIEAQDYRNDSKNHIS